MLFYIAGKNHTCMVFTTLAVSTFWQTYFSPRQIVNPDQNTFINHNILQANQRHTTRVSFGVGKKGVMLPLMCVKKG